MLETVDNTIRNIMAHGAIDPSAGGAYIRIQRILFDAMRDIKINVSPDIRTVFATIGSDFSVEMPKDSIRVYKVGRLKSDGSISIYGEDKRYFDNSTPCDCPGCSGETVSGQSTSSAVTTVAPYCSNVTFHNFWFGNKYGELFGARDNKFENGTWSENGNSITFSTGTEVYEGAKVVIEYETSFNKKELRFIKDEDADILRNKVLHEFFLTSKPSAANAYYQKFRTAIANRKRRKTTMNHAEWMALFTGYANISS